MLQIKSRTDSTLKFKNVYIQNPITNAQKVNTPMLEFIKKTEENNEKTINKNFCLMRVNYNITYSSYYKCNSVKNLWSFLIMMIDK